jgi:hypothetical protein
MLALPRVRVGGPIRHEALAVFPLFGEAEGGVEYLLSDEAIAAGTVTVEEISETGSVPELRVTNSGDSTVLFLEGEELRGAKQNRVLNTSVLVGAQSVVTIPVSCVEHGRWGYRSRHFQSSGSHSSPKLRKILKESVSNSAKAGMGHRSDQSAVWNEVSRQMKSLGASSETAAMSDTFEDCADRVAEFHQEIAYVEGATGVAVAVADKVVALDLFDKPATCQKVWARLLSGVFMDALEASQSQGSAQESSVESLMDKVKQATWEPAKAVGVGEEFRSDSDPHTHASALLYDATVIHGSVVVAS